jgi:hypothetical protein
LGALAVCIVCDRKLPSWFEIETPVGKYNPAWAILKHDGTAMYLARDTKGTKGFLKHIRLLERAGLVRRDVRGREHVLSFNVYTHLTVPPNGSNRIEHCGSDGCARSTRS